MKSKNDFRLFGIPNCDTVKKARNFLDSKNIEYEFMDFKKNPPTSSDIARWKSFTKAWPVNSRGPTYRKIRELFEAANDEQKMKLLVENSSAIKRPILEKNGIVLAVGFDTSYSFALSRSVVSLGRPAK